MPGFPSLRHMAGICAVASVCAMLGGCGAGSAGVPATGSGSRPSASPPATTSGGSSASANNSAPAATGSTAAGLTGNLCTDLASIRHHVPAIPPRDMGNLAALQQDATRLLTAAAAYFSGLAGESPPRVASALRTLASTYQQNESVAQSQTSAASLEHLIQATQYSGPALGALRVVARYVYSNCT